MAHECTEDDCPTFGELLGITYDADDFASGTPTAASPELEPQPVRDSGVLVRVERAAMPE